MACAVEIAKVAIVRPSPTRFEHSPSLYSSASTLKASNGLSITPRALPIAWRRYYPFTGSFIHSCARTDDLAWLILKCHRALASDITGPIVGLIKSAGRIRLLNRDDINADVSLDVCLAYIRASAEIYFHSHRFPSCRQNRQALAAPLLRRRKRGVVRLKCGIGQLAAMIVAVTVPSPMAIDDNLVAMPLISYRFGRDDII